MKARCEHCLQNLKPVLGAELDGNPPRAAAARGRGQCDHGRRRPSSGTDLPWVASTPGDLAVLDSESGVLFGAD
jgi:hypothetical protein